MSLYDYQKSKEIDLLEPPFEALIMAACRKADSENAARLRLLWPSIYDEVEARYHAPGGILLDDPPVDGGTGPKHARRG